MELVDTLALGANAVRREGSSPFIRTIVKDPRRMFRVFYYDLGRLRWRRLKATRLISAYSFGGYML